MFEIQSASVRSFTSFGHNSKPFPHPQSRPCLQKQDQGYDGEPLHATALLAHADESERATLVFRQITQVVIVFAPALLHRARAGQHYSTRLTASLGDDASLPGIAVADLLG